MALDRAVAECSLCIFFVFPSFDRVKVFVVLRLFGFAVPSFEKILILHLPFHEPVLYPCPVIRSCLGSLSGLLVLLRCISSLD